MNTLTLRKIVNFFLLIFSFFQSQCASSGSTAAFFRDFAGYVLYLLQYHVIEENLA